MSTLEAEIGFTLTEYYAMTRDEQKAKSAVCTPDQIREFNALMRQDIQDKHWKQRNEGTYPHDVEMRAFILKNIVDTPIGGKYDVQTFGPLFEDYITTYPVNVNMSGNGTTAIGAYGGILNYELLSRAIDEILEVAFDKFGFMLEYLQTWDYLSPTFAMITGEMRRHMDEYK